MQVTFFIGNGFDRAMGLRTSYKNFYEFCLGEITQRERKENRFQDEFIKALSEDRQKGYSNWSDLEIKLGNFMIEPITDDDVELYGDFHRFVGDKLCAYLEAEEKRANLSKMNSTRLRKNLETFFRTNGIVINPPVILNFIVFNYTGVLEKIIKKSDLSYKFERGRILNVHGSIQNGSVVFGIGEVPEDNIEGRDESKKEENIKGWDKLNTESKEKIKIWILKEKMLKDNRKLNSNWEKAKNLLKASDYIITFGASIGKTDSIWWKYVKDLLKAKSNNSKFIVSEYEEQSTKQAGHETTRDADKIKELMDVMGESEASEEEKKQIQSKIQILWNPDIFSGLNVSRDGVNDGIQYESFQQSQKVLLLMPVKPEMVSGAEKEVKSWLESICDDKGVISNIQVSDAGLPKEFTVEMVRNNGGNKRIHYSCFEYNDEDKYKKISRLLDSRDAKITEMYIDSVIMLMDFSSTKGRLTPDEQKTLITKIEWYVIWKLGRDWAKHFLFVIVTEDGLPETTIEMLKESVNTLINDNIDQTYTKDDIEVICKNSLQDDLKRIIKKSLGEEGHQKQKRRIAADFIRPCRSGVSTGLF